jgi:hypothetical protein
MAGIMWMVNVASGVAAIAALYAIWRMVGASEVLMAVKWGVAALALFQVTSLCKTFMANRMKAKRLLRELKRVELQVAMLRDKPGLTG